MTDVLITPADAACPIRVHAPYNATIFVDEEEQALAEFHPSMSGAPTPLMSPARCPPTVVSAGPCSAATSTTCTPQMNRFSAAMRSSTPSHLQPSFPSFDDHMAAEIGPGQHHSPHGQSGSGTVNTGGKRCQTCGGVGSPVLSQSHDSFYGVSAAGAGRASTVDQTSRRTTTVMSRGRRSGASTPMSAVSEVAEGAQSSESQTHGSTPNLDGSGTQSGDEKVHHAKTSCAHVATKQDGATSSSIPVLELSPTSLLCRCSSANANNNGMSFHHSNGGGGAASASSLTTPMLQRCDTPNGLFPGDVMAASSSSFHGGGSVAGTPLRQPPSAPNKSFSGFPASVRPGTEFSDSASNAAAVACDVIAHAFHARNEHLWAGGVPPPMYPGMSHPGVFQPPHFNGAFGAEQYDASAFAGPFDPKYRRRRSRAQKKPDCSQTEPHDTNTTADAVTSPSDDVSKPQAQAAKPVVPALPIPVEMDDEDLPTDLVDKFLPNYSTLPLPPNMVELRTERQLQREHQVILGRDTAGYQKYTAAVAKHERQMGNPRHPVTPRVNIRAPRRQWKKACSTWRQQLHMWDAIEGDASMAQDGLPTLGELGLELIGSEQEQVHVNDA